MNKKLLLFSLALVVFTWLTNLSGYAQVTIGSNNTPRTGTLLDLQMNDASTQVTSTKGLMLPRVALTSVDSLMPMLKTNTSYIDGTIKNEEDALHTGLVVYNAVDRKHLCKGLYMWDGSKWNLLHSIDRPEITVNDIDGNTYRARWFGDDCDGAYWTVDDLRTKRFPNGDLIGVFVENDVNEVSTVTVDEVRENPDASYLMFPHNEPFSYDQNPQLGLFYSLAATLGRKSISDGKDHGNDPKQEQTQGICPNGWHLPSDYEWSILEKEIALNPQKYSTNTGTSWDNSYFTDRPAIVSDFFFEDSTAWRGTHAISMIVPNIKDIYIDYGEGGGSEVVNYRDPLDEYYLVSKGKSNGKGFDVRLYGAGDNTSTRSTDYWAGFWTSSNAGYDSVGWYRFLNPAGDEPTSISEFRPSVKRKFNTEIQRDEGELFFSYYKYAFNVRCMKYTY